MIGKTKEQIKRLFNSEPYKVEFIENALSLCVMSEEGSMQYIFSTNGKCVEEKPLD